MKVTGIFVDKKAAQNAIDKSQSGNKNSNESSNTINSNDGKAKSPSEKILGFACNNNISLVVRTKSGEKVIVSNNSELGKSEELIKRSKYTRWQIVDVLEILEILKKEDCLEQFSEIDIDELIDKLYKEGYPRAGAAAKREIMSTVLRNIGLLNLDGYLQTKNGKEWDTNIRSMFIVPEGKQADFETALKKFETKLYDKGKLSYGVTYKEIRNMFELGIFSDTCLSKAYDEKEYPDNRKFAISDIITAREKSSKMEIEGKAAQFFLTFNIPKENKADIWADKQMTWNEVEGYVSKEVFDVIDRGMLLDGKPDGKVTLAEIEQFYAAVKAYSEDMGISETEATKLYRNAKCFRGIDRRVVEDAANKVRNDCAVTDKDTLDNAFKNLNAYMKHDRDFQAALGARYKQIRSIQIDNEEKVRRLCNFVVLLPYVSMLDEEYQKKYYSVKLKRRYDGGNSVKELLAYLDKEPDKPKEKLS